MLYLLSIGIMISLLTSDLIFADEQKLSFFKEANTYAQTEECSDCAKEPAILNPDLKKKTKDIEKEINRNFANRKEQFNNEIILFIDPDCRFSDGAVSMLVKFKKDNPGWKVKGVILTGSKDLKEKLLQKRSYFGNDIEFSIDLGGSLAKQFDITKIPSYVIIYHGSYYKIAGQPDLNEILGSLAKVE